MFTSNLTNWRGHRIVDLVEDTALENVPDGTAFRIRYDYDTEKSFENRLNTLADSDAAVATSTLVIGLPGVPYEGETFDDAARLLIERKDRFPKLKALFWGDFTFEECEVSWSEQTSAASLIEAFPGLEHFVIRGAEIDFHPVRHICLQSLEFQSGGLPVSILSELQKSVLPDLKCLRLWTGDSGYGWDGGPAAIGEFLQNFPFPTVTELGILNTENADEAVKEIIESGIIDQLDTLDVSHGTVGDVGARLLLDSGKLGSLGKLVIERHYISEPLQGELRASDCKSVELEGFQGDESMGNRYVSVGE